MNTTIPPLPRLDIDQAYRDGGWRPNADQLIERQIAWALLHCLVAEFPDKPLAVYDGERVFGRDILIKCDGPKAAMELIFNLDEAVIRLGKQWVFLVMGNGRDVVADYGVDPKVEAAVNAAMVAVGLD